MNWLDWKECQYSKFFHEYVKLCFYMSWGLTHEGQQLFRWIGEL